MQDDTLTLMGPNRALAASDSMYFEFHLKIKGDGTTRNTLIHDGLLWSQTSENASQLTHDDHCKKRHVSRVIHLLDQNRSSQVGFSVRHG